MSNPEDIVVLHVDDEPSFTELTAEMLEREDGRLHVETATSASEGLARLADREFDCIVSDYEMPGTDGIEFLRGVREEYPELPFVLFTGKGSESVASEAIAEGATDYLRKESGTDQYTVLAHRIENAVSQYEAVRRARRTTRRLEEQNGMLSTLFNALPAGVLAEDASGEVLAVNQQYLDLWEISATPEEVIGESTERIIEEVSAFVEDPETFVGRTRQLVADGEPVTGEEVDFVDGRTLSRTHRPIELPEGHGYLWIYRDVTDRKERTRRLERQQERIEMILAVADLVLWRADVEDGTVSWRGPVEQVFGVPSDEIPTKERFIETVVHPADRETAAETFRQVEHGAQEVDEITFRTGSDTDAARWVWTTAYSDDDPSDDGRRVLGLARDITDLAKLERTTGDDGWYRTLLDRSIDITAVIDDEGIMQYKNPAMAYHLGYEPHGVVDENAIEYVHPDDVQAVREAIGPVIEGDEYRSDPYEYRFRHADGSWHWFESVLTDCTDTQVGGYLVNSRNVSDRKAYEREQRQYRQLVDAMLDPAAIYDTDGRYEVVNTALAELHDADPEELRGTKGRLIEHVRAALDGDPIAELIAGERTELTGEFTADFRGRGVATFEYRLSPLVQNGDVDGIVGVGRDITERTERKRELERQNERLDEFVSVVSHDLRSPLQVADGRLALAAEECDSDSLDDVGLALDRMRTLIDDLRALAREGEPARDPEPVDLAGLAESAWRTVATEDASLAVDADATVLADEGRVKQLLENFMRNAIEHGGDDVTVTVGDLDDGFYVADDGPGIPDGERTAVFESGYSTSEDGTGFGLAIVERIAEAHGWDVRVTDGAEGGARFEVTGVEFAAE